MTIEIRILHSGDEALLINAAADVFDNPVDADRTCEFLADPRHPIAVAIDNDLVVGFASECITSIRIRLPSYGSTKSSAPTYRHCGLGKAVLQALLGVGRAYDCTVGGCSPIATTPPQWPFTPRSAESKAPTHPAPTTRCSAIGFPCPIPPRNKTSSRPF
jgi:hypothetical protein